MFPLQVSDPTLPVQLLPVLFFFVALMYSSVGMGSRLGATRLTPDTTRNTLGVIILIGIVFLISQLI